MATLATASGIPYPATSETPNVQRDLKALADYLEAMAATGTAFTPTWTASTTNPAIGNGTISARWFKIGNLIFFRIKVTAGSTTTFGTGSYTFTLTGLPTPVAGIRQVIPAGIYARGAGSTAFQGLLNGSLAMPLYVTTAFTALASTTAAWASGDTFEITGHYLAA